MVLLFLIKIKETFQIAVVFREQQSQLPHFSRNEERHDLVRPDVGFPSVGTKGQG